MRDNERLSYKVKKTVFTNPMPWSQHEHIRTRLLRRSDVDGPVDAVDFATIGSVVARDVGAAPNS